MDGHGAPGHGERKTPWVTAAVLFACAAAAYIALRTGRYCGDMVWQSRTAETIGQPIKFKADHLFYGPMVRGIYVAWKGLGLPGRAHIALQTVNGLFGGITVAMMFLLVWRLTGRKVLAVLTAVFLGLTPYVWIHATDVETYSSTKALMMVAVFLCVLLAEGGSMRRRCSLAIWIALFHALATYIHYGHVMLVPAVIAAALAGGGVPLSARLKVAALYLVAVGVLVWGPFVAVYLYAVRPGPGGESFLAWLLEPSYGWPVGARMGFTSTPMKLAANAAQWPSALSLPFHRVKMAISGRGEMTLGDVIARWWARFLVAGIGAAVQVSLLAWGIASLKRIWARWRPHIIVSVVAIAFYQLFQVYWGGGFMGMALPLYVLLLVFVLVDVIENARGSRFARVLVVAVPAVCVVFAALSISRYVSAHDEGNNMDLQEVLAASKRLDPEKDLIIGPGGCLTSEYWGYFAPDRKRHWLEEHDGSPTADDRTADMLDKADMAIDDVLKAGGKVYVFRLYADEDDEMRPWNEFKFKKGRNGKPIDRKSTVEHFRKKYKYEVAFEIPGRDRKSTYWRITGLADGVTPP